MKLIVYEGQDARMVGAARFSDAMTAGRDALAGAIAV